jgi:hypothetical protein
MITKMIRTLAAVAAIGVLATWALPSAAQTPSPTYHYDTALTDLYGSSAPYSGSIDLRFASSGIISGYYQPDDLLSFVPVTGGRTGDDVWFEIGSSSTIHVTATIKGDAIVGQAYNDSDNKQYAFKATLTKTTP